MKTTTLRRAGGTSMRVLGSRRRIVCAIVPVMGLIACGPDTPRGLGPIDEPFSVEASVHPIWRETLPPEAPQQDSAAPGEPKSLTVYLDMSRPMAGFLPLGAASPPREGSRGTNEFRAVAQWVPDHLTRVYATAALRWRGVGRDIRDLAEYPRFERSLFDATASRLDLAIQEALADLRSGRSEGAALISDLLGTGELTGALAVSRYFEGWLNSEAVRTSEFQLGLVGVKASYWGGSSSNCPPINGLGCWYSERGRGWRRLDDVVVAPFYVLLMGRSAESLSTILESIESDAASTGIETVSELLTAATRPQLVPFTCDAYDPDGEDRARQYALHRDAQSGEYSCVRSDLVRLSCSFGGGFVPNADTDALRNTASGGFAMAPSSGDGQVEVDVDCGILRSQEPFPDLVLGFDGDMIGAAAPPWSEWSIETDDVLDFPGKTLQLRYFIEEVRVLPDGYGAELPPILRGGRR